MKRKTTTKPLALRTRTLRTLTTDECRSVVGGVQQPGLPAGFIMRDTVIVRPDRP
jgi:hypothetical protein